MQTCKDSLSASQWMIWLINMKDRGCWQQTKAHYVLQMSDNIMALLDHEEWGVSQEAFTAESRNTLISKKLVWSEAWTKFKDPILCYFLLIPSRTSELSLTLLLNDFAHTVLLLQHLYSVHVHMLHFSACPFKAFFLKSPVFSDWSTATGLNRTCWPPCIRIRMHLFFFCFLAFWVPKKHL